MPRQPAEPDFDYAILGGGAAGLSLALALSRSPLAGRSVLIVDPEPKDSNDRRWSFWTDAPSPYDGFARRTWERLRFLAPGFDRTWELAPFRYVTLRSLDFYQFARQQLADRPVTFVRGVGEAVDGIQRAAVRVDRKIYRAKWVFDSRPPSRRQLEDRWHNLLLQHFLGWEVETAKPTFDPGTVTLFDLRTPQRGGVTFFYILPFRENRALVEYTLFSPALLADEEYESALRLYLMELAAPGYRILEIERGVIPMTDRPLPRRLGRRILAIGTRGGRVKPSTGYAFARIQRDSERIVASLVRFGHPFSIPADPLRSRLQDSLLLEILACKPSAGRAILSAIFRRNPLQRVLRFLDGRTSWLEDMPIMAAHPPAPFLAAAGRLIARRFGLRLGSLDGAGP